MLSTGRRAPTATRALTLRNQLLAVVAALLLLALVLLPAQPAMAANPSAFGNGNFHGISSTPPEGYLEPPDAYQEGDTVEYRFRLTNVIDEPVTLELVWNVTHILRLGEQEIGDGYPEIAGSTFKAGWQQAVPQLLVHSEPGLINLNPGESKDFTFGWKTSECGYFQLDLGRDIPGGFETLNSGYIRVLGCEKAAGVAVQETNPTAAVGGAAPGLQLPALLPITGSLDEPTRFYLATVLVALALVLFGLYARLRVSRRG
ncbi:MAG: hypothetical protein M1305_03545 [Candidatus Marsarchaeota archaeon]|nr:hypothetical protein [Candidatus Marsarchaeota archaeon]